MARIVLENVSHTYDTSDRPDSDKTFAVQGLDICWDNGTANALLGPSGCGKTTLLNIISGLLTPSQGRVLIDGRDVTTQQPRERKIAQVFQFPVVYDAMSVYDNLAFPLRNAKYPRQEIDAKVREVAEILDLTDLLKAAAAKLNPADKQKISLGRGIVREDTAAILLDEPLTVIDPKLKWYLRRKLKEVQEELGRTMIYVTHDQHEALTFADQVTVIRDGVLVQNGTPQELHDEPQDPFIGYFIGSPGMNFFECHLEGERFVCRDQLTFPVPQAWRDVVRDHQGEQFGLGIRPEFVHVHQDAQQGAPCQVQVIEDTGAYRIFTLWQGDIRIKARVSEAVRRQEGDEVGVTFREDKMKLFQGAKRII
ncbi:ABC transporter ATP-binding protein [Desulfohalobium retbaense]|uniref:ABC transporter related protein n=1 Tax=Desulfohalobium retbaense (strain ATCC 49708 / DSM 5692 / JCM 16813 / HR100) TaxID=485915 RepID=C8X4A9_DESRD|nr:ABC transporter ATP-binding protein [Desulfohalobium retbaense]ACV69383.1 ABC transporter related protein [Desulfohalobium retbaense DSM 5692]